MAQIIIFTGVQDLIPFRTMGAYQVAHRLRENGYTVQVVEYFPQIKNHNFNILLKILNKFVNEDTLWIGFSSTFITNNSADSRIFTDSEADIIKDLVHNVAPKCRFVIGGAKSYLRNSSKLFDTYIEGYADASVIRFTKWLQGKDPFFQFTKEGDILAVVNDPKASTYDFTNSTFKWHPSDFIDSGEGLPIEISRGCIFKCGFCSFPLNGKNKLDYIRNSEVLVEQFIENYNNYGTTNYVFVDDTHNDSSEKLTVLYEQVYSKLPFKINFATYLRLDLLAAKPWTIKLLKDSGIRLAYFGIESLNEASNRSIGKGISKEKIIRTLDQIHNEWGDDVITFGNFIVGLPHDSIETVTEWMEILLDDKFKIDALKVNPLILDLNRLKNYPWDSEFLKDPAKHGYTFNDQGWVNNTGMSRSDAIKLVNKYSQLLEKKQKTPGKILWSDTVGLAGLNYSWDEVRNTFKHTRNPDEDIHKRLTERIARYVDNLLS